MKLLSISKWKENKSTTLKISKRLQHTVLLLVLIAYGVICWEISRRLPKPINNGTNDHPLPSRMASKTKSRPTADNLVLSTIEKDFRPEQVNTHDQRNLHFLPNSRQEQFVSQAITGKPTLRQWNDSAQLRHDYETAESHQQLNNNTMTSPSTTLSGKGQITSFPTKMSGPANTNATLPRNKSMIPIQHRAEPLKNASSLVLLQPSNYSNVTLLAEKDRSRLHNDMREYTHRADNATAVEEDQTVDLLHGNGLSNVQHDKNNDTEPREPALGDQGSVVVEEEAVSRPQLDAALDSSDENADPGLRLIGNLRGATFISLNQTDSELALQPDWPTVQFDFMADVNVAVCNENTTQFLFPKNGCWIEPFTNRVHCQLQNVQLDLSKVHSAAHGGELLESVMGQSEEAEFLRYDAGAFEVEDPALQRAGRLHYLDDVFNSVRKLTEPLTCRETWRGTTLFLTRYEYVNLYHTLTDWWNTYFSLPSKNEPVNIVLLDAHPKGNLDSAWTTLFGGRVVYAQHLRSFLSTNESSTICFETARFVPPGYSCPFFPGLEIHCPSPAQGDDFVRHVLEAFNLTHVRKIPGRVVVLDRVPYVAHPRSHPELTERLLKNLKRLAAKLPEEMQRANITQSITVRVETLVHDDLRTQIKAIRQAHFVIGNHGAGLTHGLFLEDDAHMLEMSCEHGFFAQLMMWRPGVHHHCLPMGEFAEQLIPREFWEDNVLSVLKRELRKHETATVAGEESTEPKANEAAA